MTSDVLRRSEQPYKKSYKWRRALKVDTSKITETSEIQSTSTRCHRQKKNRDHIIKSTIIGLDPLLSQYSLSSQTISLRFLFILLALVPFSALQVLLYQLSFNKLSFHFFLGRPCSLLPSDLQYFANLFFRNIFHYDLFSPFPRFSS
jgi:hypothetical protein